jgi:hypothetical protein
MKLMRFFAPEKMQGFADPKPAKSFIPDWYKDAEVSYEEHGHKTFGLKTCMPYLDALTSGYILSTPVDLYINEEKNDLAHLFNYDDTSLNIRWGGPPQFGEFIGERSAKSGATMPRPAGHYPNHLVFRGYWAIKTPRGYSMLMTQPLNRHDLPFTIASGIVDSDKYFAPGNIPFFVKKGFSGVVPKGTPIAQLIPIKRETWTSYPNDPYLAEKDMIQGAIVRNKGTSYKKKFWQRKAYG